MQDAVVVCRFLKKGIMFKYLKLNAASNMFEVEFLLSHVRNKNSNHLHSAYINKVKNPPQMQAFS